MVVAAGRIARTVGRRGGGEYKTGGKMGKWGKS